MSIVKMIYGQLPILTIETTDSKDGHHAQLLIDGNLDTFYADNLETFGAEIKLTLLKKYRVYSVGLNLKESTEPVEYQLSYYQEDINSFVEIKKGTLESNESFQLINFSPITTNKLSIKFLSKLTGVGEIRAYGYVKTQSECEHQPSIIIPQSPPIAVISSNVSPLNEVTKFPLKVVANFTESIDPNNDILSYLGSIKKGDIIYALSNIDVLKVDIKEEGEYTIELEVTDKDGLKDNISYNFTVVKKEIPKQYDKNGVLIFDNYDYEGTEDYNPRENYQTDSKRLDFESVRMDSVVCGGYFKVKGDDEYSAKLGGGSHNDSKPKNARCYIIGVNFNLQKLRIRLEADHSQPYTVLLEKDISEFGFESGVDRTVGLSYAKINEKDGVRLICWIDPQGLDSDGKPVNNWVKVLDQLVTNPIWYTPFDVTDFQNTIRIDKQDDTFEYKYAYARKVNGYSPDTSTIKVSAGSNQTVSSTLPVNINLNGSVSGTSSVFNVTWSSVDGNVTISSPDSLTTSATITQYGTYTFTLNVNVIGLTFSSNVNVKVQEEQIPTGDDIELLYPDGRVIFKTTGNKEKVIRGGDPAGNGIRFNADHKFKNYLVKTRVFTGKNQELIEMKTDGPCHGCGGHPAPLPVGMWYEPHFDLATGKSSMNAEAPHSPRHDYHDLANDFTVDLLGNNNEKWIGYIVAAYTNAKGQRVILQAVNQNPDTNGRYIVTIQSTEKGDGKLFPAEGYDGTVIKFPRNLDDVINYKYGQGFEAEIRMHGETGDAKLDESVSFVYEIIPPN